MKSLSASSLYSPYQITPSFSARRVRRLLMAFLMLSIASRRLATAFVVPRIPPSSSSSSSSAFLGGTRTITATTTRFGRYSAANTAQRLKHPILRPSVVVVTRKLSDFALEATKSSSSTFKRNKTLVVHGPPGFEVSGIGKKKNARPFKLVIVESPSKCETISKILQNYVKENNLEYDFVVTSCMGHIRNLPKKKTDSNQKIPGVDLENHYRPIYEILPESLLLVEDLKDLTSQAKQLVLATDDDREGEAMAWHLLEVLGESLQDPQPLRVRFTEITPKAIVNSIENAETSLRDNLVQAQETRRILDRLAGFTVSPILWKKIAPGLSAGRVQSVGMALIVQRERERLAFKETEYWDLQGEFSVLSNQFQGQLISVNGVTVASGGADFEPNESNKLTKSSRHKIHLVNDAAHALANRLKTEEWTWTIANVTSSKRSLKPPPPFITSTLQQEANNRLGLSVSRTMQAAQQLYEKGYISYMRTDSTHLSEDARQAVKNDITSTFGDPDYFQAAAATSGSQKKKKNQSDPQAAHEAIRPAIQPGGIFQKPSNLPKDFDSAARELYELIYKRTLAAHMPPQISNSTTVRILGENGDASVVFKTSGSIVLSPGYTMLYSKTTEKDSQNLPPLKEGEIVDFQDASPTIHTTQPPPRYTEASFVKELEALGVGRPSTYAGTVQILRDRAYVGSPVNSDNSRSGPSKVVSGGAISALRAAGGEEFAGAGNARGPLVPSLTAFVVCSLFEKHCNMYVDSSFTAKMEERLDKIANAIETIGEDERVQYLNEFYEGDNGLAAQIQKIEAEVDADDARRAILPTLDWNSTDDSDIGVFVGPWGPYVKKVDRDGEKSITAQLPAGMASDLSTITPNSLKSIIVNKEENGSILGKHPDDGRNIRLKVGRFGAFLQCGEDGEDGTTTHTLPRHLRTLKSIALDEPTASDDSLSGILGISFEEALAYVNLPRTVCTFHDLPIIASIGPYGPYLKYNNTYLSLKPSDGDVISIEPNTAEALVTEGIINRKSKSGAGVLAEIGEMEGKMVTVKMGRFGSYINWKSVNAKLPSEYAEDPSKLPLEEAWSLISEKAAQGPGKSKKGKKGSSTKTVGVALPLAPKRALSAYLYFCAEKRPEVAATSKSLGDVSKELARLWKELPDRKRETYNKMAEAGKAEYEAKKMAWIKECDEILDKDGVNGKKKPRAGTGSVRGETAAGPKRPKSAYMFFASAKREEVSKIHSRLGDVSKELGRMWAEATPSERGEYEEMAAEDKLRYEREKLGGSVTSTTSSLSSSSSRKATQNKKKKLSIKKKAKKGPSAYMLFCAAHRNDIVDEDGNKLPLGETTKQLAKLWHECDDRTREKFQADAEKHKTMA